MTIVIAGGGIGGLALGLTLHQIGLPFRIYEAVADLKPLGVGINLQPNAVRELYDLGLADALDTIGVKTRDYGFYTKTGLEIWTEPRGTWAGYRWPQYSVHRGELQMLLAETLRQRAGAECIVTGHSAAAFEPVGERVRLHLADSRNGAAHSVDGDLLIGADGIHSAVRRQLQPDEGEPIWGGAVLWRATTEAVPFLSGASMILMGHDTQRVVAYPISQPDPQTGMATINWIAELTFARSHQWNKEDYTREAQIDDFLPRFADWTFDWIDVPALVRGAAKIYEYPMVDRDPIERWSDGRVTVMGDAAHPTYPVGSSGASQAIVDARIIGAKLLAHGVGPQALRAYEDEVRPATNAVTLANRSGGGPDAIMQMVEDRCSGVFDKIDDVIPRQDLADHAAKFKTMAGFGIEALNQRPDLIAPSARRG